jgi:hypothetical protein
MKRSIGIGTRRRRPLSPSLPSPTSPVCMPTTMTNLVVVLILMANATTIVDGFSAITTSSRTIMSTMNSSRSLHHQRQAAIISTPTHTRRPTQLLLSSALPLHQNFNDDDSENDGTKLHQVEVLTDEDSLTPSQIESLQPSNTLLSTVKEFFIDKKAKFNRESLSKLGMSALLAYGFVSNISGVIAVSSAWFIFCKKVSNNRYRLQSTLYCCVYLY